MEYRNGMPAGCWGNGKGLNGMEPMDRPDKDELTQTTVSLASEYGRYGSPRIYMAVNRLTIGIIV